MARDKIDFTNTPDSLHLDAIEAARKAVRATQLGIEQCGSMSSKKRRYERRLVLQKQALQALQLVENAKESV